MKDKLEIEVSANLTITDKTVQRCLTLIAMNAQDKGTCWNGSWFQGQRLYCSSFKND